MKLNFLTILLIIVLGVSTINAQESNFFRETWKAKTFSDPTESIQKQLPSGSTETTISISPADTLTPVLPVQLGLNTTFRSGTEMLTERLYNYKNSGMGAFRFPAGSGSNTYFWDGNIPDKFRITVDPIDGTKASDLNISEFVAFIDSMGAEATIVVNYFYARYGITSEGTRESRVNQAAEYAAGFVNYVNNVLKANIKYWEVGNECYGKWEVGFDVNGNVVTGKEYGEDFRVFAKKMKEADPSVKVGAVMWPKNDNWNDQVMKEVKNDADFLITHNYFTAYEDATVENILSSTFQINEIKQQMEDCIIRNTSFSADHFPVAMTEYNNRGPHTTTFLNACFTAEVLGRMIESGYGLATRWVGEWQWKVGTHGLFAIDDPDQKDYSVRQAYLIYHYLDKAFGDQLVKTSTTNSTLRAFGSRFSDGKYALMVINPGGMEQSFNLKLSDEVLSGKCWWYELYANTIQEDDKKFYVNGFTSTTNGGGPDNFVEILPFETRIDYQTQFCVKKYSVSFFVFDTSLETGFRFKISDTELEIYPNPASHEIFVKNDQTYNEFFIYSMNSQLVHHDYMSNPIDVSFLNGGQYLLEVTSGNLSSSAIFTKN